MGSGVDNISTGAGNDTIAASAADLLANDIIDGGDGTDTLTFEATSYADESVFGGVTNVEKIKPIGADGATQTFSLNANIDATIFDFSDDSAGRITFAAGYTNPTTVELGLDGGTDSITNGGALNANIDLTVTALDADAFTSDTTVVGGTGTDTIELTANSGSSDFNATTGVEKILVVDDDEQILETMYELLVPSVTAPDQKLGSMTEILFPSMIDYQAAGQPKSAGEFIEAIRNPNTGGIDYKMAEMKIGTKLKGDETIEELVSMYLYSTRKDKLGVAALAIFEASISFLFALKDKAVE